MIRLDQKLKTCLLHPLDATEKDWQRRLQRAAAYAQPLLIETVGSDFMLLCPNCLQCQTGDPPAAGAAILICEVCGHPFVALRFMGGPNSVQWFSFPWPR